MAIGWNLDFWDGDGHGFRLSIDAETESSYVEFGLLMSREEAFQHDLLDHVTHGDSSAKVDVATLDPECDVYMFGGLAPSKDMLAWLKSAVALMESQQ
jgi:hypothetical protein